MVAQVKAHQVVAEHPLDQLLLPRENAKRLAIRPWNVPELADEKVRVMRLQHPRHKSQVIVLNEDHSRAAPRFVQHSIREEPIVPSIAVPVDRAEGGPLKGNVAQRPEAFIRKTVVIFFLELL